MESNEDQVALDNCSKEPIHIPGRIQNFAALVGFDIRTREILYQSENCAELLNLPEANFLGKPFSQVFTNQSLVHGINGVLGLPSIKNQRERAGKFPMLEGPAENNPLVEVAVILNDNVAVLELEPIISPDKPLSASVSTVRTMLSNLEVDQGMDKLLESATRVLRSTTGYDRVMAYRFLENGDGEVAAETRSPRAEPFLGLRYPAYDVPSQVRDLMLRMTFRTITDIHVDHSPVVSSTDQPLDMTRCHCRGVSPIHIEYLQNMGVASTMNISIIAHGKLWGMFAFHHYRPRLLDHDQRVLCELFGQLFSMQIQQEDQKQILLHRKRASSTRASIREMKVDGNFQEKLSTLWPSLAEIVNADGVALITADAIELFGDVPEKSAIRAIVETKADTIICVDSLEAIPNLDAKSCGSSAGVLAMDIDGFGKSQLAFFRNEIIHDVKWGGQPVKQIKFGKNGPRLHPRGSFAEYSETVRGKSKPWQKTDLAAATELRGVILEVMFHATEVTQQQQRKQELYQDMLIGELNHRVKNILSLVRSISRQTLDSSHSLEVFTTSFEQRISALSKAHDLIGGSGMQWAPLNELLRVELSPYVNQGHAVELVGEAVRLRSDVAPVISLVIHELVTNAAKHGALSQGGTSLKVHWQNESGGISILWKESGLNMDANFKPNRGFGLTLIERAIPYECDGESSFDYQPDGVEVRIWLPSDAILFPDDDVKTAPMIKEATEQIALPSIGNALIVEDNMMLALELEKTLKQLGCASTTAIPSVKSGLEHLEDFSDYALAVMDINLGDGTSFELAEEIHRLGIPIIFASGYDDRFDVPESLLACERLTKPIEVAALSQAIAKVL